MYSGLSLDSGRCSGSQSHLRGAAAGQGKYSYRQIRRRQRWQRLVKAQSAELRSIGPSSSRFDGRTSLGQSSAWARLSIIQQKNSTAGEHPVHVLPRSHWAPGWKPGVMSSALWPLVASGCRCSCSFSSTHAARPAASSSPRPLLIPGHGHGDGIE